MALLKCPECGKKISDKATACIHCGCPLEKENQELKNETEKLNLENKNQNLKDPVKILLLICKVVLAVTIYTEITTAFGYLDMPILLISSLLLVCEFLFLIFAFPRDIKGIKIVSLLLAVTEVFYAAGMIIYGPTIKSKILIPIMCITNAIGWISITLKLKGKALPIFEKTKLLYVIVPLLKPIIFLFIKFDLSGALLWAYAAIVCGLIGYVVGYEKITTDYSAEECAKHQKSSMAGFLSIAFFPIGVFLLWKNKCFSKVSRIVGTILAGVWFPIFALILIGALIPCEHNWVGGSCTEVAVCDICGENASEPVGHVIGDWSEWDVDYDEAINVREKICTVCEEVIDTETEDVTTFVNGNHFTIYPSGFAERFEEQSSRLNDIDFRAESEYDEDMFFHDEDNTVYYRLKDKNDDYSDIGIMSFGQLDGKNVAIMNNFTENCISDINILIEESYDVSAVVYSAILAIDPRIDYSEAADVGQEIVDSIAIAVGDINEEDFQGVNYNGINYLLYRDRKYHYLVIRPQ